MQQQVAAQPAPPKKAASRLGQVKAETIRTGLRFCFYGPEAVGKTTLAAGAPAPIFFDIEDGSHRLKLARYPFHDAPNAHVPHTYEDVMAGINDLLTNDHVYQTLVIDTLDRLESLIWNYMLRRDSGKPGPLNKHGKKFNSIEEYGYGKGFQLALDEWRKLAARLDELRRVKGMNIISLAHASVKRFGNPDGEDWDRYQLRIQDADRVSAAGFWKEWNDVVGFCIFEQGAKVDEDQRRAKGYSTGRRLMHLERSAAYDAKTRLALPPTVELSKTNPWGPFAAALLVGLEDDPAKLIGLIRQQLDAIGSEELAAKVKVACEKAKDNTAALGRYLVELRRRQAETTAQQLTTEEETPWS